MPTPPEKGKDKGAARNRAHLKARAWALRCRGKTQESIARELGVDRGSVSKWLAEVERRELARLSADVETKKVLQDGVLEYVLEESLEAWERSKAPRTRVRETKGPDEVTTDADGNATVSPGQKITEVVQQTGDVHYVDRALAALAEIRKLWGLNVADQANQNGPGSFAERVKAIKARAAAFDARPADGDDLVDEPPPPTPGPGADA